MPGQSKIISSVNIILSQKGISLKLNNNGVCSGLVALFVKYFLKGDLPEFFRQSQSLANPPKHYQIGQDEKFDQFILETEIAFNPQEYNKNSSQGDLDKIITIDGVPVKNEYNIGLVENEINWTKVLEEIRNNGRACYVAANKHAVGLAFENDQYIVFDPNYQEDEDERDKKELKFNIKTFNTATDAIAELKECLFLKSSDDVGLEMRVFARPNAHTEHQYPDKRKILLASLNDENSRARKAGQDARHTSLFFALGANDEETIEHYLKHKQVNSDDATFAICYKRDAFAWNYFSTLADLPSQLNLLCITAQYGSTALLNRMLQKIELEIQKNEVKKQELKEGISDTEPSLLEHAALSNNLTNLVQVVELYKRYGIKITSLGLAERLFEAITASGNSKSLGYLIDAKFLHYSSERIVSLVKLAAKNDNRSTLQFWLEKLAKEGNPLNNLEIDAEIISKISPLNFKLLMEHGFTVKPSLLRDALQHPSNEIFKIALKGQPETEWIRFLRAVAENQPLEPFGPQLAALFDDHDGLNAFEVLARFERNRPIKQSEEIRTLSTQGREKALEFACQYGNAELVHFLVDMDCKASDEFKLKQLKSAANRGDLPRINTILAARIDGNIILPKGSTDYELADQLIEAGKYRFVTDSWGQYSYSQRRRCLLAALTYNNKAFILQIIKDLPFCYQFIFDNIKDAYTKNQPSHLTKISPLFAYLGESDLSRFWQVALEKDVGKESCQFTLKYAILNHHFVLARKMVGVVPFSNEEAYQLFIEASTNKNHAALAFLGENYAHLLANTQTYRRLLHEKHFELIALILEKNQLPEKSVSAELLQHAVTVLNQKMVSRLSAVINDYFRVEGSPLYWAIHQENAPGAHLLVRHGAKLDDELLASGVFTLTLKDNNSGLLSSALKDKNFAAFFARNEAEHVGNVLSSGSPDLVYVLTAHVDVNRYYEQFITYAIEHNDLRLFQMLRQMERYAQQDKEKLFLKACMHQSINIANELLRDPIDLGNEEKKGEFFGILLGENAQELLTRPPHKNKTIQHVALKMLFGEKSASDIYELVYKKALNRLYVYIKDHKFPSALASLHRSVEELVFDSGFIKNASSGLRNTLIARALNEGDAETFGELLKQLDKKPPLSKVGLSFFTKYFNNPLLRKVLLEHYPLGDVVDAAVAAGAWPTVITLLMDRKEKEFEQHLIRKLGEHRTELMEALVNYAKKEIHSDPRHKLNALLLSTSTEILSVILKGKEEEISALIMAIQQQMIKEKMDLKHHFYEFDLYAQIMKGQKVYEEIQSKIQEFFAANPITSEVDSQQIVDNEQLRTEIIAIRTVLAKHDFVPGYFEESDSLVAVFDALDRSTKEQERRRLEEQKRLEEQERLRLEEQKRREEQERLRLEEQKRLEEQERLRLEDQKRLEEQERLRLEDQKRLEEQERLRLEDQKRLEEQERLRLEDQKRLEEQERLRLEDQKRLEEQERLRLEEQKRREEQERLRLEEQKRREEQERQRLEEQVCQRIEKHTHKEDHHPAAERHEGMHQRGTQQLIDRVAKSSQPDTIQLLIKDVLSYRADRASKGEVFFTFLQYSRQDKLDASQHFIEALQHSNRFISAKDRGALNNGQLFDTIDQFLDENKPALKRALHCNWELDSVDELIDFLNSRNPVNTLIWMLHQYADERTQGDDVYWPFFANYQYTKKNKIDAVNHLIRLLKGEGDNVTENDLGALKQGSLGRLIQSYIEECGFALEHQLGFEINDIDDLVANKQQALEVAF
ncbi:MAP7 domain-containing protein [Legionella maceachernii]|uniref:MAP7 domain-containing protein n=1 Tax=Legionella maceachernii TaxID=466 RepID=UPI00099AD9F4|nr:hypothetical protein [Legionella maceachernii]SKA30423.1 hypothetical protein SAMN02745128_03191 [Legionella maceachernii]